MIDDIIFISTVMLQGVANSHRNFNVLVRAFVRSLVCNFPNIFGDEYRALITSYVDDLFGGAKTWGHAAYQQLFCMIVGALMGIEFHPEKIDPPDFIQKILGYLYNCKTKTIGIDKEKNEKFFALCRKLAMFPSLRK